MRADILFLALASIVNISLGLIIVRKNRRSITNRVFALFIFLIAGWILCLFLINFLFPVLLGKLAFCFASLIPATFLYFSYVFPKEEKKLSGRFVIRIYLSSFVFLILLLTPLLSENVVVNTGYVSGAPGLAFPLFILYFLSF